MKKCILAVFFGIVASALQAQELVQEVEMADEMRSNGKIYVVVSVLSVIFTGIVIYLVKIDRKISKMEESETK